MLSDTVAIAQDKQMVRKWHAYIIVVFYVEHFVAWCLSMSFLSSIYKYLLNPIKIHVSLRIAVHTELWKRFTGESVDLLLLSISFLTQKYFVSFFA